MSELMSCPSCGNQVSRAARSCPSCGHPFAAPPKGGSDQANTVLILAIMSWFCSSIFTAIPAVLIAHSAKKDAEAKGLPLDQTLVLGDLMAKVNIGITLAAFGLVCCLQILPMFFIIPVALLGETFDDDAPPAIERVEEVPVPKHDTPE